MKPDAAQVETAQVETAQVGATGAPVARASGRSVWFVVGAAFSALLIGAGTLAMISMASRKTETQHRVYSHAARKIVLDLDVADLTLRRGEAGSVDVTRRVRWGMSRPNIDERWDGDVLRIRTNCPSGISHLHCDVDYVARVPADVEVEVRTSTGDVSVEELLGPLRLTVETGDITVAKSRGAVWMRTDTGDVRLTQTSSANVDITTDTGDVTVRFVAAPSQVKVYTGTGDARVFVPSGDQYRVATKTNTGDVSNNLALDTDASRSIEVRTDTGDVELQTN